MSTPQAAAILRRTIQTRFIFLLYRLLQIAFSPALALYLLYRGFRNRAYRARLPERFGFLPASLSSTGPGSLWVHAVSVGEVLSAVELIRRVKAAQPGLAIFLSTATLAGRATAEQRLDGLVHGVFFAPLDYVGFVRRVLRRLRPTAVVVMETEIWPNLYREAKRSGASLLVVNGRISDRALPRYRTWNWFFRHALGWPDAIWVQSAQDARRYLLAGAPPDRVQAVGNLKFDFYPPNRVPADLEAFFAAAAPRTVWIAASTMPPSETGDPDEDDVVIEAFQRVRCDLLILAPRRPERFEIAAEKLRAAGLRFVRRTELAPLELPGVLLLNSIGDLAALFARADVVFMGGTLARRGGHNILEPAYFAKPVIAGPHMENFAGIAEEFTSCGALHRIPNAAALAGAVEALLAHPGELGARAQQLAHAKRGVVDCVANRVLEAVAAGVPDMPRRRWLWPFACLWSVGHRINLATKQPRALSTRVVSVGGLTMGGSGKTPLVAHLAERLEGAAILTRGYRRQDASAAVIVPRGTSALLARTGDEAQLYIRRAVAHVGISANRYEAGRQMEAQLKPSLFLLDDGFQHTELKRACDIVVIDVENPWGGGLFPVGQRREPLSALARATAIVLTRIPKGAATTGIERAIKVHTSAPIFRTRMVPEPLSCATAAAFCGIGSPAAFWGTLAELSVAVVHRRAFPDHHRYRVAELEAFAREALSQGATILLTTEKDLMNLPANLTLPLPIQAVRIHMEIENEAELLRLVRGSA